MAAAALTRSKGVAGVRPTKSLTVIFSLLCLASLATGLLFDEDELKEFKRELHREQKELELAKAGVTLNSQLIKYYADMMEPLTSLMKKTSKKLPDDFPPLEALMESLKGFVEKGKNIVDEQSGELSEKIENTEKELRQKQDLIKFLEEQQAEL